MYFLAIFIEVYSRKIVFSLNLDIIGDLHNSGNLPLSSEIYYPQVIPYYMKSMEFGAEIDGSEDFFQMFWPVTVSHKITEDSELYDISSRDISCRFRRIYQVKLKL